jgi:hypothetical protein
MIRITSQILLVLILIASISAQTEEQKETLIDEFGETNLEETVLRLDVSISQLLNRPNTKLHFKIYGGNENYFARPYLQGTLITAHLKNNRQLSSEKYSIEFCNVNKESFRTQIFIISQNHQFPKCEENLELPARTILFDKIYFQLPNFELTANEDSSITTDASAEGYSRISFSILRKLLADSSQSKIHIIAYLQTNLDELETENEKGEVRVKRIRNLDRKNFARKMLGDTKKELSRNGIKSSQIKTISGGYVDDFRRSEIWFVPKGGEIPKPKPDYFPKKNRKIKANKFNQT